MCLDDIKERYVNFYTDFAFKKFFGTEANKELLIDFLNQLLEGRENIVELSYLPNEQFSAIIKERKAVFDVYCKDANGDHFIVEMQNGYQKYYKDRTLYYSTFPIREQAERVNWNFRLNKIYSVNILNFDLPKYEEEETVPLDNKHYIREVMLMDKETKTVFYDKLIYIYIEMSKFNKELDELETTLDKWLYAIKHLASLKRQPEELQNRIFNRLFELAEIAKYTREERFRYEDAINTFRDYNNIMQSNLELGEKRGWEKGLARGMEEGIAKGMEEGIAKGMEEGIAKGMLESKYEVAKSLLSAGLDIEFVAKHTGLTIDELKSL